MLDTQCWLDRVFGLLVGAPCGAMLWSGRSAMNEGILAALGVLMIAVALGLAYQTGRLNA